MCPSRICSAAAATRGRAGARIAVHQGEDRRIGQPEADVQIPPGAQVRDRIGTGLPDLLLGEVGRESVLGDGVDQAALVTEEPVDRGCLHPGRGGVTGATGQLGRDIAERLLERVPADQVGVSVRTPEHADGLRERGVRVRRGDFDDAASLRHAFEGATQVLIVSVDATGEAALRRHRTAIEGAVTAGARRVLWRSRASPSPTRITGRAWSPTGCRSRRRRCSSACSSRAARASSPPSTPR
jgi:hypothetical protein